MSTQSLRRRQRAEISTERVCLLKGPAPSSCVSARGSSRDNTSNTPESSSPSDDPIHGENTSLFADHYISRIQLQNVTCAVMLTKTSSTGVNAMGCITTVENIIYMTKRTNV